MPRLKLIEMDSLNKMIYFRKDDKLIAFDADVAIELISDSLDGKHALVRHGHWINDFSSPLKCSSCGIVSKANEFTLRTDFKFCPYCGAKMNEVGEDD